MSAINALVQRSSVHMITDGLSYHGGIPFSVDDQKTHLLSTWRAALAATGPALLGEFLAGEIARQFRSFDHVVSEGEQAIERLFRDYVNEYRNGDAVSSLVLIGWHNGEDRPMALAMDMATVGEKLKWVERHGTGSSPEHRFKLLELKEIAMPPATLSQLQAASYTFRDYDAMDPETDLLHLLEIQRRILVDGHYYVGGQALLTSIDKTGVRQRIIHRWDEDEPGKPITPRSINWKTWLADHSRDRTERTLEAAGINLSGLSRLQRERMWKKAKKGTLR